MLLAGGKSTRMNQPKGLVEYQGTTWIAHQLKTFAACGGERAVVVLGHDKEKYLQKIPELGQGKFASLNIEIAVNPDPSRGQFSSLLTGLEKSAGGAFILPVDVPAADAGIWKRLEAAVTRDTLAAAPVHEARGGHPVLLTAAFIARLMKIPADKGRLDEEIRRLKPGELARVPVDDAKIEMNLNQPSDWTAFEDN